jgi:hypothetical protein
LAGDRGRQSYGINDGIQRKRIQGWQRRQRRKGQRKSRECAAICSTANVTARQRR